MSTHPNTRIPKVTTVTDTRAAVVVGPEQPNPELAAQAFLRLLQHMNRGWK